MLNTTFRPEQVHTNAWIAPGAVVVGDVTLEEDVNIWFNAVIRGDTEAIRIGAHTNIQDGCILHADPNMPLTLGEGVIVGHGAILHGATIGSNVLIGMGAIVLNGAVIGDDCIIGAGAVVTEGQEFPSGLMVIGNPASIKRALQPQEIARTTVSALNYVKRASAFRNGSS